MLKRNTRICFKLFIGENLLSERTCHFSNRFQNRSRGRCTKTLLRVCNRLYSLSRCEVLHVLVFSVSRVSAALLRQATYGTIKIGIYQKIKRVFAADIRRM